MKVILLQKVEKLGQIGDIVAVKAGYARNYLIPNQKCLRATSENQKIFEERKAELELQNLNRKKDAAAVASKVEGYKLVLIKNAGEAGHLYGSVKVQDIAKELVKDGYSIDKAQIMIQDTIKSVGIYDIKLSLHPEVVVNISLNIARSKDEADLQEKKHSASKKSDEAINKKELEEKAVFESFEKVEKIDADQVA